MTHTDILYTLTTTPLPASVEIAPGCVVVDVQKYIDTNIARLESDSALLRGLALKALERLAIIIIDRAGLSPV